MLIFEKRASTILYKILSALPKNSCFLVPANVCPVVIAVFLKAGIGYEFVDISEHTYCIDEKTVLEKLQKDKNHYTGILFVRTYGYDADFSAFFCVIKKIAPHILVIDDKCLSRPAFLSELPACVDVVLFSSGYSKYVDIGWGGYAYADDRLPYNNSYSLRFNHLCLDELQKNIKECLLEQKMLFGYDSDWLDGDIPPISFAEYKKKILGEIGSRTDHKRLLNQIYHTNLPASVQLPDGYHDWRFIIVLSERNVLLKKIFAAGLFAGTNYPSLSHIFGDTTSVVASTLHGKIMNLFNDDCFSPEQAWRVVRIINAHLSKSA